MALTVTRKVGKAEVTVLTDGEFTFSPDLFPGTAPERIEELRKASGREEIKTNFNAVLIRMPGQTVLVDGGTRGLFGPTTGHLPEALQEAGIQPETVSILYATHLHPDHIAGFISADGTANFPNAELVITEAERAFWSDPANTDPVSETMAQWGALARAVLQAYADRLRIVAPGGEIAPGLRQIALPGHTPGHGGFRFQSAGEELVHVGDIVHAQTIQIPDPEISIVFDLDAAAAREHRKRLLDMLATDGVIFTGGHFLYPAFNRLEREGQGFRLLPA